MLEVIQCLIDWLKQEPSDEKAHRILRALANEALKFAKRGDCDRRFTVEEILDAVEDCPAELVDTKKWLDWRGSVLKYWNSRELQVIEFARKRGLQHYPKPERYSPKGGRGNHVTFCITAQPMSEMSDEEVDHDPQASSTTQLDQVTYNVAEQGAVKPAWFLRGLLKDGQLRLNNWHIWLILGVMLLIGGLALLFSFICWALLSIPKPVSTSDLTLLVSLLVLPYVIWIAFIRPWVRLFEDRIVLAHDVLLNIKEKPAQFELLRDGDLRLFRLVSYFATCPICGATIYLEDGAPDYKRRLVGRCYESPREHVFSFDRVTRRGRALIEN